VNVWDEYAEGCQQWERWGDDVVLVTYVDHVMWVEGSDSQKGYVQRGGHGWETVVFQQSVYKNGNWVSTKNVRDMPWEHMVQRVARMRQNRERGFVE
jgi:hypothetical protein